MTILDRKLYIGCLLSICLLTAISCPFLLAQKVDITATQINSLVDTEREFAKLSAARGMREAFLAYLADDSIVFRPGPVNGKKWITEQQIAPTTSLTWEPIYADVSLAGDFGYTTGPYEYKQEGKPASYGYFVSIWKKQQDNKWKVVIDLGVPTPQTISPSLTLPKDKRKPGTKLKGEAEIEKKALLNLDRDFSQLASRSGTGAAFREYLNENARLLRVNNQPLVGKKEINPTLSPHMDLLTLQPENSDVSQSLDMGYTYGTYDTKKTLASTQIVGYGHYVRIWKRKSKEWMLMLEVLSPSGSN
jgi:ketosteroid isomerase-like protein